MNAQDLKNSILQLAVQGKLVEQRPEEGTAKELLEQIKAEKEKLIKEKKIKKEKPLPEITEDEIPFEIPESWEWVRLDDVLEIARGASPRPIKDFITNEEDGVNWIKIGDSDKGGKYINSTAEKITLAGKEKSRYVQRGSFLLSNSMSFGRPYILNIDGCIHDGWLVINQRVNVFEQDYLYYVLSSKMVYYQFCNKVSGAVVNNLNSDKVRETIVPIPPLEEQKRIVAKIEEIFPYIEQYDKAYTKLEIFNKKFPEDMKKSILQLAMQGKLVEQRPEEGTANELYEQITNYNKLEYKYKDLSLKYDAMDYDIPSTWKMVELNSILSFVDYRGKTPTKVSEGVFLITASNIKAGYMDYTRKEYISEDEYEGRQSRGITEKGDLLFTTEAPMGNIAVCDLDKSSCGQRIITFKEYIRGSVDLNMMMYFILSPQFQKQLIDNCTGTTAKGIKAEKLKHFLIPLPPLAEQKRIVAKIEELLPYCDQLTKN